MQWKSPCGYVICQSSGLRKQRDGIRARAYLCRHQFWPDRRSDIKWFWRCEVSWKYSAFWLLHRGKNCISRCWWAPRRFIAVQAGGETRKGLCTRWHLKCSAIPLVTLIRCCAEVLEWKRSKICQHHFTALEREVSQWVIIFRLHEEILDRHEGNPGYRHQFRRKRTIVLIVTVAIAVVGTFLIIFIIFFFFGRSLSVPAPECLPLFSPKVLLDLW